jgi:hypothetical protein
MRSLKRLTPFSFAILVIFRFFNDPLRWPLSEDLKVLLRLIIIDRVRNVHNDGNFFVSPIRIPFRLLYNDNISGLLTSFRLLRKYLKYVLTFISLNWGKRTTTLIRHLKTQQISN